MAVAAGVAQSVVSEALDIGSSVTPACGRLRERRQRVSAQAARGVPADAALRDGRSAGDACRQRAGADAPDDHVPPLWRSAYTPGRSSRDVERVRRRIPAGTGIALTRKGAIC